MKNVDVFWENGELKTELSDYPVPEYGDNEVLIKVVVAASNPKDWKHPHPDYFNVKVNQGDDVAGIVEAVGKSVKSFKPGDRVAGFHVMDTPRGTYAEFTVVPENTMFHIPDTLSFEEAATFPLAAYTAAEALYRSLLLPAPYTIPSIPASTPLIINGAGSTVGSFALKLADNTAGIHPIIAIAGSRLDEIKALGATTVLNYRDADIDAQLKSAVEAAGGVARIFDAAPSDASIRYLLNAVPAQGARYVGTTGIPPAREEKLKAWGGHFEQVWVGSVHDNKVAGGSFFGSIISKVFELWIAEGKLRGQRYKLWEKGLASVDEALKVLMEKGSGGDKFVYRVADTPGLSK